MAGTPRRRIRRVPTIREQVIKMTAEHDLDNWEIKLLLSVPLRGTQQWNAREELRLRLADDPTRCCYSPGFIPEEGD